MAITQGQSAGPGVRARGRLWLRGQDTKVRGIPRVSIRGKVRIRGNESTARVQGQGKDAGSG